VVANGSYSCLSRSCGNAFVLKLLMGGTGGAGHSEDGGCYLIVCREVSAMGWCKTAASLAVMLLSLPDQMLLIFVIIPVGEDDVDDYLS
jgi:hypothetical protein